MSRKDDLDALGLGEALSGLIGSVGNVRWWFGQVSEAYPARDRVPDTLDTLREVALTLRDIADNLDALPRP